MVEEELEIAWAWLHNRDLLEDPDSKELPPEQALCRFWVLSKCQFGDTVGEAIQHDFLHRLLPCEDKLAAIQMDIRQIWDPKYHYCLYLTNTVPIRAKLPHLHPEEEAWLNVHLNKLVAKGVIGPILPGEQPWCVRLLLLVLGV